MKSKTLTHFEQGQKIAVVNPDTPHLELKGKHGTVARIRISDGDAWVDVPGLPERLSSFEDGDPRRNHVVLSPDECARA